MKCATPGFDFTAHLRRLCDDMVARLPELAHIDMAGVALCCRQAKKSGRYGLLASMTPLRFEGGSLYAMRRGRRYTIERLLDPQSGRELLYIFSVYLPRFMEYPLVEKLATVLHELWHIGPNFDGDLRRHPGRCYAHTASQKQYDAAMHELAQRWLAASPAPELYDFLRGRFRDLQRLHGGVYGARIRIPRLRPAAEAA